MNHCRILNCFPISLIIVIISCQSCAVISDVTISRGNTTDDTISQNDYLNIFYSKDTMNRIWGVSDTVSREVIIDDTIYHDEFCGYFYSKDTLNDTLHFNFADRLDFGPVYLSDDELKQIYSEIKRGNIDAYDILCSHYFYTYSFIPNSEIEKLICITDYLGQRYSFIRGYLALGNFFFYYLNSHDNDYYAFKMITYYEKYFNFSKSKSVAIKLYEIYSGKYSFCEMDSIKAKYYEDFVSD